MKPYNLFFIGATCSLIPSLIGLGRIHSETNHDPIFYRYDSLKKLEERVEGTFEREMPVYVSDMLDKSREERGEIYPLIRDKIKEREGVYERSSQFAGLLILGMILVGAGFTSLSEERRNKRYKEETK